MSDGLRITFFGSSLVSSYWNGACTYYRGLISALAARGHRITFYEPRAYGRQEHRDIPDPPYARVVVYEPSSTDAVAALVQRCEACDVIVKCSGVGVHDAALERAVATHERGALRVFWDVDAPATLSAMESPGADEGLRELIPSFDCVLTYGGGDPVVERYAALGARRCIPIYNGLDPSTHHPVAARRESAADLTLVANRLPDREARIDEFFFGAAALRPELTFLLGGSGWSEPPAANIRCLGHVATRDHNAINSSARAVLNVSRDSMAANGYSPATRVFEAAGAGACVITDEWAGIETFFAPGDEILVARDGAAVARWLDELDPERARRIGAAARERALTDHTYAQRAELVEAVVAEAMSKV
jgi:spore maturation protein CgeB